MMNDNSMLTLVPMISIPADEHNAAPPTRQKRNTKAIGILSELVAMQRFSEAGFALAVPFGDSAPYDMVLDDLHGHFYKIQVKTGRLRRGVILFSCCSQHWHRNAPPTHYTGLIDAFGVYCPDNDEFYVVPIDAAAVTISYASLRVAQTANNNSKLIHWAKDYRFDTHNPGALLPEAMKDGAAGED